MTADETMDDVYLAYMSDDAFRHLRERANFVPGDGSQACPVVFIGEAPGAKEDANGRPFCGRAGNVLDAALFDADLRRDLVWTTNTIKYRPPGNRTPTPEEVDAARPYLRRELVVLARASGDKPVIVPLGAAALSLMWSSGGRHHRSPRRVAPVTGRLVDVPDVPPGRHHLRPQQARRVRGRHDPAGTATGGACLMRDLECVTPAVNLQRMRARRKALQGGDVR